MTVYSIQPQDRDRAGAVLDLAFRDDPVFTAIFTDATPEQRLAFFTTPVHFSSKYGRVIAPSDQLEGVAAWLPAKYADMKLIHMLMSGTLWMGMRMGMKVSQKLATVFKPVEDFRKNQMRERDYLYLLIIGVAPQFQGQGFGGRLLDALLADSEQSGLPIYLETETENNVSLYEHHGFEVLDKLTLPIIDLPMWLMIRETGAKVK